MGKGKSIILIGQVGMVLLIGIVGTRVWLMIWPRLEVIDISNLVQWRKGQKGSQLDNS